MVFKKKEGKKKVGKKKVFKKKGFKKSSGVTHTNGETILHLPFKKNLQMFPDVYRTKGHCCYSVNLVEAGSASNYTTMTVTIGGNWFSANNVGNSGGAYGTQQVPAGVAYLLGDASSGGSHVGGNAPYLKYRVLSSMIKVTLHSTPNAAATNGPLVAQLLPNDSANPNILDGLKASGNYVNISEEQYCVTKSIPAVTTGNGITLVNKMSTLRIFGEKYKASIESGQYDATYNGLPNYQWQWLFYLTTMSNSATNYAINVAAMFEWWYDIECFERNTVISSLPS